MFDFKWVRNRMGMGVVGYGFFCAAVAGAFLWTEDFLFAGSITPQAKSLAVVSIISMVRGLVLFLMGLPFIVTFYKRQMEQEELAGRDDITGLCNHRQLMKALGRELARARRYEEEFSVIMIDIDNFKTINDHYGHVAGDQILREMGALLAGSVREVDIAGRYGGDEFLLLLPHTGYEEAQRLVWRLWSNVQRHPFKIAGEMVHVSASLGISSLREMGEESDKFSLIHAADQAMFDAKNTKHQAREKVMAA